MYTRLLVWTVFLGAACAPGTPSTQSGKPVPPARTTPATPNPQVGPTEVEEEEEVPQAQEETPCVNPTRGMQVTKDTRLCAGTFEFQLGAGEAAVVIAASDVKLSCEDTVLVGKSMGTTEAPTAGIFVGEVENVTVEGCTAKGFRYGVSAKKTRVLTLNKLVLDENFHDPALGWVQDTVQGGGIRLEQVEQALVQNSSFRKNWNGIELRGSRKVKVYNNTADHCSNTGATLVNSHENELTRNDMSWGIRGDNLEYPGRWWGIDTKDSAGIILDAGSSKNRIAQNDFRYGGDGVFIRSVIGVCAEDNIVEANDTSFSPHNAIECWCDGNQFIDNIANDSHYGIWLGGTDRAVVKGNLVERSKVDGVSIQIAEDRHSVLVNNIVRESGRAGMLLTGRQYQAWHPLTHWEASLANSSHLLVEGNVFEQNATTDLFITSTRGVLLASNCGAGGAAPKVTAGNEAELIQTVGGCGSNNGRGAPTSQVSVSASAVLNQPVTLSANGSTPVNAGETLSYTWLVQPAGTKFAAGVLPQPVLQREGQATESVTFTKPGLFDVNLTVHDGKRASLAWTQVAVLPAGRKVGQTPAEWATACQSYAECITQVGASTGVEGDAVHFNTDAPYDFAMVTPAQKNLALNATSAGYTKLGFFIRAKNTNKMGWQENGPKVVLGSPGGTVLYEPAAQLVPVLPGDWVFVEVPLAGGNGWKRTVTGGTLSQVNWVELRVDTWDFGAYDVWVDGLTFY